MVYQDINFKICLSLFGWKENILPKQHIVHWRKPGKVENGAVLSFGQSPLACGCCFTAKTLESVLPVMIVYVLFGF